MQLAPGLDVLKDNDVRVIPKPWGREVWLTTPEENGKYVFKILEINKGHVTSLQYHERKIETMYFEKGEALLHYRETKDGETKTMKVGPGTVVQCKPEAVHRIEALSDIRYFEAQTPDVEDVVRLEDGYGREGTSGF